MAPDEFARECREVSRALRRLPREVRTALRDRVRPEVAEPMASDVRAAGTSVWARRVAATTRTGAGADPRIVVGSAKRVTTGGATARDLVFGINFPAGTKIKAVPAKAGRRGHRRHSTRQFVGRRDPFVFSTIGRNVGEYLERWADIVADTVAEVTRGRR